MLLKASTNNADSCETARNDLSLLKSALFATWSLHFTIIQLDEKWSGPIVNMEESTL